MQRAARPASREPFRTEAARSPQISVPACINSQAWPVSHSSIRETSASTWNWKARACLPTQKPDGESPPWMPAGALRKGHRTYPRANAGRVPPPDNEVVTNAHPPSGIRFPTLFPWPFRDKRGCRGHGPSFELRGIRPAKAADFPDACGPNPVPSSNRDTIPYPPPLRDRPAPRTNQPPAIPGRKDRERPPGCTVFGSPCP